MPDYVGAQWAPSPNFAQGRKDEVIQAIVLHGTAGGGAVSWFQNPASQVSAHYVVETDGAVSQCVLEDDCAWHAGESTPNSAYAQGPNPNLWTIGIEHVRDIQNQSPITPLPLTASLALVADILKRRGNHLSILTHDEIQVGRVCPGPDFPLDHYHTIVQPGGITLDPVTTAARERFAGYAAAPIQPLEEGAIFKAYVQKTAAWLASGRLATLDPTPAIRPEVNTGHDAYVAFDSGEILHWQESDGMVYLVATNDRAAIWHACHWQEGTKIWEGISRTFAPERGTLERGR